MFRSTCGMGDLFSIANGVLGVGDAFSVSTGIVLAGGSPPPPPGVVYVATPNQVNTGGMPGGDLSSQYMPTAKPIMQLTLSPAFLACTKSKGVWDAKTGRCLPKIAINLRGGTLARTQRVPTFVPPQVRAPAQTKILLFGGGGAPGASGVPDIAFEQRDNLWIVSAAALPVLQGVLSMMTYQDAAVAVPAPGSAPADPVSGQANFILGLTSGNAGTSVDAKIAAGYAALVNKQSVSTGVLKLVFTQHHDTVVQLAGGPSAEYALITDQPAAVVAGALASVNGGTVPASSIASTPWLAIGVVAAGVAIAAALFLRKPARATANGTKSIAARRARIAERDRMGDAYKGSAVEAEHLHQMRVRAGRKAARTRKARGT